MQPCMWLHNGSSAVARPWIIPGRKATITTCQQVYLQAYCCCRLSLCVNSLRGHQSQLLGPSAS